MACQSVEPWQRAQLSTPRMQREPHGAHAAFLEAGFVADPVASKGLTATGASATLYVRSAGDAPAR